MLLHLAALAARTAIFNVSVSHSGSFCVDGTPIGVPSSILAVVAITCVLSMIGASLIVLSYALIPEIRTKAREILVHLSLMDFMAATANFAGVVANFDDYLSNSTATDTQYHTINNLCLTQASFAMYGTISSVIWTICIGVYIYLRIMYEGLRIAKRVAYTFYLIAYGIPLIVTLWFSLTGKLGYARFGGSGWCSVILYNSTTKETIPFNAIFANDLWIYLTIIIVPVLFLSLHFYLRNEMRAGKTVLTPNLASTVHSVEVKLLFIPVLFIVLRIWSLLLVLIEIEGHGHLNCTALSFFLHIGGIGDSGQGLANFILFCGFTPKVRQYFLKHLLLCRCLRRGTNYRSSVNNTKSAVVYGSIPSDMSENTATTNSLSVVSDHHQTEETRSLLAS